MTSSWAEILCSNSPTLYEGVHRYPVTRTLRPKFRGYFSQRSLIKKLLYMRKQEGVFKPLPTELIWRNMKKYVRIFYDVSTFRWYRKFKYVTMLATDSFHLHCQWWWWHNESSSQGTNRYDIEHDDVNKWKHFLRYWPFVRGNPPVTGGFPSQRQVTRSFDVFFDLYLNKRLEKQTRHRWFETPLRSLWRHCNVILQHQGYSNLRAIIS